ncbi:MAG TPA: 2Fe-2S iron-sulfur cluster-binding protein, partial [Desulfobacterales bacterium]|nr:2Fe-2S iron-sulfur cluster-binding protein [Desulfobacterales bacterium]
MDSRMLEIRVDDRTIRAEKGASLLEAMVAAGLLLRSDCGGRGRCGKCLVRVASADPGWLSAPDESERRSLGDALISTGHRLACRAVVYGEVSVQVPGESRLAPEVVQKGLPTLLSLPAARSRPPDSAWGIAVDVGTTTVAVYLCDLEQRTIAASTSIRNPQAIFGDDVISRISAVRLDRGSLPRLQSMTVSAIDWAVNALCRK